MSELQRHRGPDDRREEVFEFSSCRVGLGFVRLAILDLETGMQPITCPVDGSTIACNGQVYNYVELRDEVAGQPFQTHGDMEVALHLYRKLGTGFLSRLNGMYAGAVLDRRSESLLLFRDRFGIKPLYYTESPDGFFFSSEIKPLLAVSRTPAELDRRALPLYFTYRFVPGERTAFRGILRLPPGSFLRMDLRSGEIRRERYWEYVPCGGEDRSESDLGREFCRLFRDAVRIRLRSDVEVGSLLSGGVDSSAVCSEVAREQPGLKLFTIGFEEREYDETAEVGRFASSLPRLRSAEMISRTCTSNLLTGLPGLVKSVEEPLCLGTMVPTDQVSDLAAASVKVVLSGEGADEILAGYRKFLLEMAAVEMEGMPEKERSSLLEDLPELTEYVGMRSPDPSRRYVQSESLFDSETLRSLLGSETGDRSIPPEAMPSLRPDCHPVDVMIAMECRARLPDYVILRLDKLSMRHSLEVRTPFLDYRIAELLASAPARLKVDLAGRIGKYLSRKAMSVCDVLPEEVAFRPKIPFTIPLADWLQDRSSFPEPLREVVEGNAIRRHGLIDSDTAAGILNSVSSQGVGPSTLVSDADRAFSLLVFSLWYEEFVA